MFSVCASKRSNSASSCLFLTSHLSRLLEGHVAVAGEDEVNDATLVDVWYTPPEALGQFQPLHIRAEPSEAKICIPLSICHYNVSLTVI